MSLLERLNHAFSGGIMFVQPTAKTNYKRNLCKRNLCFMQKQNTSYRSVIGWRHEKPIIYVLYYLTACQCNHFLLLSFICTYIFATACMGLSSIFIHFCGSLQKMYLICNRACIDRSRAPKVDDFGTNQKRIIMRLPISPSYKLWSCLATFLRLISDPCLIRRPRSLFFPLEFRGEVHHEETICVMGWRDYPSLKIAW